MTAADLWPWLPDRIVDVSLVISGAWILGALLYAVLADRRSGRPARVLIATWQQSPNGLMLRGDVMAAGRTSFALTVTATEGQCAGSLRLRAGKAGTGSRFEGTVTRWDRAGEGFRVLAAGSWGDTPDATAEVVVLYRQTVTFTVANGGTVLHTASGPLPGRRPT